MNFGSVPDWIQAGAAVVVAIYTYRLQKKLVVNDMARARRETHLFEEQLSQKVYDRMQIDLSLMKDGPHKIPEVMIRIGREFPDYPKIKIMKFYEDLNRHYSRYASTVPLTLCLLLAAEDPEGGWPTPEEFDGLSD